MVVGVESDISSSDVGEIPATKRHAKKPGDTRTKETPDGSKTKYRVRAGRLEGLGIKDKTFKNPIATPRGKKKVPELVNRDKVNIEKKYSREDWLRFEASDLGEAGLAYLAEVERQRYMCGNLSGKVDGIIKDCNATASNIIEALVEKLTVQGDVSHLRTQNLKLTEELVESRRLLAKNRKSWISGGVLLTLKGRLLR